MYNNILCEPRWTYAVCVPHWCAVCRGNLWYLFWCFLNFLAPPQPPPRTRRFQRNSCNSCSVCCAPRAIFDIRIQFRSPFFLGVSINEIGASLVNVLSCVCAGVVCFVSRKPNCDFQFSPSSTYRSWPRPLFQRFCWPFCSFMWYL